jgi:hypothetical protein
LLARFLFETRFTFSIKPNPAVSFSEKLASLV